MTERNLTSEWGFKLLTESKEWLRHRYLSRQSVPVTGSSNRESPVTNCWMSPDGTTDRCVLLEDWTMVTHSIPSDLKRRSLRLLKEGRPKKKKRKKRKRRRGRRRSKTRRVAMWNQFLSQNKRFVHKSENFSRIYILQCESTKKFHPWIFLTFFLKRLGIFSPNFTRLLRVSIYAGVHIFNSVICNYDEVMLY